MTNLYSMEISLNVLNHLGIKLYSNTPSVISEAIANSWDAGAENVWINIDNDFMSIKDDGVGMTSDDINQKFLLVGYQKRENGEAVSPRHSRKVMGRKGIGKLSLFSIANSITVFSCKNGIKSGFEMNLPKIQEVIARKENTYNPTPIKEEDIPLSSDGTLIVLRDFKKNITRTEEYLRKRIARRFGFVQENHNFQVIINNNAVTIADRHYFDKLQSIWYFGSESETFKNNCNLTLLRQANELPSVIDNTVYIANGWIGTVNNSGTLREGNDSLNKISILVRGKLAQEDILSEFPETGLFAKYLIGEIHADFLDDDDSEDISTSSRQDFLKDDIRYQTLREWIRKQLKIIQKNWDQLREDNGVAEATQIPAILEWFNTLKGDSKASAKKIFGKVNQIISDNEEQKKIFFQQSVLAFEYFRHNEELNRLNNVSEESIKDLVTIFGSLDAIEASLYYKIVTQRLGVIQKLEEKVSNNSLEKTIQAFLYDHLWLLDPSWERAAGSEMIEKSFQKELDKTNLTKEERDSRMDIKYRTSGGTHIIIELKRPEVTVSVYRLIEQVNKYQGALKKVMNLNSDNSAIRTVCIVGRKPNEFSSVDQKSAAETSLNANNVTVIMYSDILNNAKKAYQSFTASQLEVSNLQKILENIEKSSF